MTGVSAAAVLVPLGIEGLGDNAARAAARQVDVGDGRQTIYLYAFRGTGDTALEFIDAEPLIYAGHGALSFDQIEMPGFTPHTSKSGSEVIAALKLHESFPGQVSYDTAVFHRAQDLAEQGYRTQVYVLPISVSEDDFVRIRNRVTYELNLGPMPNKRYGFPGAEGCFNCVTWPQTLGLPMPESSGRMKKFIPAMIEAGAVPWKR